MFATMRIRTSLTSVLLLSLLTVLFQPPRALVHAISLEKLCETRCFYGRGGNLCNCNAFHFAGKRSGLATGDSADSDDAADVDDLAPLAGLALHKDRDSSPASNLVVGGGPAASGFRGEGSRAGAAVHDDDDDRLVVEGFFGVEGREKSAVRKLADLLKAAIDERLVDSRRMSRKWRERSSPFSTDGAVY